MINWLFLCNCFLYVTVHVMMAEEKWFLQLNIFWLRIYESHIFNLQNIIDNNFVIFSELLGSSKYLLPI